MNLILQKCKVNDFQKCINEVTQTLALLIMAQNYI